MRLLKGSVAATAALFCVSIAAANVSAQADAPLRVAGASIPKVFEQAGNGPYNKFYDEVVARGPADTVLLMMPVKRLARSFFEKEVDCMYMATDDRSFYVRNGAPVETLSASSSFNRIYLQAYSRKEDNTVSDWSAFKGLIIAADEGIHASTIVQRTLPFAKRIIYTKSVDEAFDVLKARRVDVTLAFHIDARQYFARTGNDGFHTDDAFSLLTLGEGLTCWPLPSATKLVDYLDQEIDRLKATGELKARYGFELRD